MKINSIQPRFKENYDVGYIGFTYNRSDLTSIGIAYFTDWIRMSDIKVSHCFIVTGEDELIEAAAKEGVRKDTISKYFNDPNVQVFFRKPKMNGGYPFTDIQSIASSAKWYLGEKYNYFAILIQALYGNKTIPRLLEFRSDIYSIRNFLLYYLDGLLWRGFICSGLVARVLSTCGCFSINVLPYNLISPQELFESAKPFYPWRGSAVVESK